MSNTSFHDEVAQRIVDHPFAGQSVPFVSCGDLAVFKAFSDRPKDQVDLGEMLACRQVDADRSSGRW